MEERGRDRRSNIRTNNKGNVVISGEEEFADLNTREEIAFRNFGHHRNSHLSLNLNIKKTTLIELISHKHNRRKIVFEVI